MNRRYLAASVTCWLALAGIAYAQSPVPPAALAAEVEGRWEDALRVYQDVLTADSQRGDLWVRVADIEARLGRTNEAIVALEQAVKVTPAEPSLHFRLSQAYAMVSKPADALRAVETAIALRKSDPEYLRAGAVLATWNEDYQTAYWRYRQLQVLEPSDATIALELGRVSMWGGDNSQAAGAFRQYLRARPDAAEVWLDLATVESWRGNYAAALDALEEYKSRFGESPAHSLALARVLAAAGRPSRAVDLLEPLRQKDPANYDVNVVRTIALTMRRSIGDAYASLGSVRNLEPTSRETRNTERFVRATLGSSIEPGFSIYNDSDNLQIVGVTPTGSLMLTSGTRLSAGHARYILDAAAESGLGQTSGETAIHEQTWGAIAQTFGGFTLSGRVGSARAEDRRRTQYAVGARWRLVDVFEVGAERSDSFVMISPKTVELGLTELRHRADIVWTPTVRLFVAAEANYQEFSDGNRRWEVRVAPRHAVVRNDWLNLDLGVSAYRLSASDDFSNGYYDPRRYEAYQFAAYPYFKMSENVGLGVFVAAGPQREYGRPFRMGGSATAEATFGIYRAWLLRVSGGVTQNLRQDSGAFRGYNSSVVLVRRF